MIDLRIPKRHGSRQTCAGTFARPSECGPWDRDRDVRQLPLCGRAFGRINRDRLAARYKTGEGIFRRAGHFLHIGRMDDHAACFVASLTADFGRLRVADFGADIVDLGGITIGGKRGKRNTLTGRRRQAHLQKIGRLIGSTRQTIGPQHHGDDGAAVAHGRCHLVEPGSADKAGLHAIGTIEATDEHVEIGVILLARGNALKREIMGIFGEFAFDDQGQQRQVAGRRVLAFAWQAVGVHVMRGIHAEALRLRIHLRYEIIRGAADGLGNRNRNVVGRLDQQQLERAVHRQLLARLEIHLGGGLVGGLLAHHHFGLRADLAGLHLRECDIGGHQLGQRRRIPFAEGFLMRDHLTGFDIDHHFRIGIGHRGSSDDACGDDGNGCGKPAGGGWRFESLWQG
ncbi:Hypothetical protein AT6N2_L0413 [Agrobacterium tumefaciens]|nr:Hypothetical protein AT6N2_L0413 [Agrobacterium tumefaciens]